MKILETHLLLKSCLEKRFDCNIVMTYSNIHVAIFGKPKNNTNGLKRPVMRKIMNFFIDNGYNCEVLDRNRIVLEIKNVDALVGLLRINGVI